VTNETGRTAPGNVRFHAIAAQANSLESELVAQLFHQFQAALVGQVAKPKFSRCQMIWQSWMRRFYVSVLCCRHFSFGHNICRLLHENAFVRHGRIEV
jgi:hypothetical protein